MTEPGPRADALRVRVAIPTFRRPEALRRLLPVVLAQAEALERSRPAVRRVDVLVVDNDPRRSASVDGVDDPDARLTVAWEPEPGIGSARQCALDRSPDIDLLAFVDDDEQPCEDWLGTLVDTWLRTRAAAVVGRVLEQFETPPEPWITAGGFFRRGFHPTGTVVPAAAAGNLLLDLVQVRELGVVFPRERGLRGGEDTLFTRRLSTGGGRIVWCAESMIIDLVPPERATRSWVLRRRYAHGLISTEVDIAVASGPAGRAAARVRAAALGTAQLIGGGLRAGLGRLASSDVHHARGRRTAARGAGRLAGSFGAGYEEYARDADRDAGTDGRTRQP